jgi:ketosteroid isomerase-like protein
MKTRFILSFVLAAAAFAQSAAEREVLGAHENFLNAARAGDAATLTKLLGDELVYSHSNGTTVEDKAQAIAAMAKSKPNFKIHEQKVHVYGKTATLRARATAQNPKGDIHLTILQVWVKKGGQWQMVQRQTTRLPQT